MKSSKDNKSDVKCNVIMLNTLFQWENIQITLKL